MLLKNVLVVNAVAGAAVASPPSTLHRRQDVNSFIQTEKPIALQGILNNFGPNGNYSRGAAPGIPVAGNSETNPPCMSSILTRKERWERRLMFIHDRYLHMDA